MSTDTTDDRTPGGPAHAFGNALAWRYSREMPRGLKGGFLTTMYALRAMCSRSGELRFNDGKVIRIQDIAKAAGCREQDARRYLEAARRAGLVVVKGERRRGVATLYTVLVTNFPDWKAAEAYLRGTVRRRKEDTEETPEAQGSGHSGPNSGDDGSGHCGPNNIGPQRTELGEIDDDRVRSTVDRPGSGHSGPNNPGVSQGLTQEMADVVTQPQVVGGSGSETDQPSTENETAAPFGRCATCTLPLLRAGRTHCSRHEENTPSRRVRGAKGSSGPIQAPLMAVVRDNPAEARTATPFRWKQEDPLAPVHVCGCGREFRTRGEDATCQDCQHATSQGATA